MTQSRDKAERSTADGPEVRPVFRFAGLLLLTGLALQILTFFFPPDLQIVISACFWVAVLLVWRSLPRRTQYQALVLSGLGLVFSTLAWLRAPELVDWPRLHTGNAYVVAMIIGVSFISLIAQPAAAQRPGHTGLRGMAETWLGTHFLGVVLNLSSVFMLGDRMAGKGRLEMPQLLVLNRGLTSAALWSPFFAAMGVVLTLAPDLSYLRILALGFPVALLGGLVSLLDLRHRFDLAPVRGFSLAPASLLMPAIMALLVLWLHLAVLPDLTIVSIITFLMPSAALITLGVTGKRRSWHILVRHVSYRLPMMRAEVGLFLSAGLLTTGLSAVIQAYTETNWTLFAHLGVAEAMLSFVAITLSALMGLHPIIGISVLASMLDMTVSEQTLFGFTALSSWAVGTSVGPLSGINLALQGRYGVSNYRMMRHNLVYAGGLFCLASGALVVLALSIR